MSELTASPLPPWRAVLMVVEHFWIWYHKSWRASVVSSVVAPTLFLVAFGLGFGSLIAGNRAACLHGVPYLVYLAPGLLVMSAVQTAAFESTYPVMGGFKWQRIYWGMAASPLTASHIALGQLCWIAFRLLSSGAIYLGVILLVGGAKGFGIVGSLLVAGLCGAAFAALTMAFSASLEQDTGHFPAYFRFVLIPMTLFGGTFYPVSQLPAWLRPIAWLTPMWHGTELARALALGTVRLWPELGHLGYLLALLVLGIWLATKRFATRLNQ